MPAQKRHDAYKHEKLVRQVYLIAVPPKPPYRLREPAATTRPA